MFNSNTVYLYLEKSEWSHKKNLINVEYLNSRRASYSTIQVNIRLLCSFSKYLLSTN